MGPDGGRRVGHRDTRGVSGDSHRCRCRYVGVGGVGQLRRKTLRGFCEMTYTVCTTHPPVAKGEVMDMRMWQGGIQQGGEQGSQGRDAPEPQGPGEVVLLLQGSRAPDPEGNIQ